jgi:hypothetical protein
LADFFHPLQRGKQLEAYRVLDDHYVTTIDGSGYFSSERIARSSCLRGVAAMWWANARKAATKPRVPGTLYRKKGAHRELLAEALILSVYPQ